MIVRVSLESYGNNNAPSANPNQNNMPRTGSSESFDGQRPDRALFGRRWHMAIRSQQILLFGGGLIYQQIAYRDSPWSVECGYDLRVWSSVAMSVFVMFGVISLTTAIFPSLESQRAGGAFCKATSKALSWLHTLTALFQFAWFLRGAYMLFIDDDVKTENCAYRPWVWSLTIWSFQALTYFMPCILVILLVPCVSCWFIWLSAHGGTPTARTPDEIITRLPKRRYGDLIAEGHHAAAAAAPPPLLPEQSATNPARSGSAGILNALPDVMGMTSLLTRLGSSGAAHRSAERIGMLNNENMCAICVCEFEEDETVILLPCDRRHIFHDACLLEWLTRSQQCPMCRQNIVDLIEEEEAATQP